LVALQRTRLSQVRRRTSAQLIALVRFQQAHDIILVYT
jgi:hypothetical protein